MSPEPLVLVLLAVGFVAAPFADLSVRRLPPRIAAMVLLIAVLAVLGYFGFAFDRGYLPPKAWEACGFFVLVGVGICIFVYRRHRFGLALVFAGAFVFAVLSLHLFAMDFVRSCQRACVRVQEGMDTNQVRNIISAEFAKCSSYRVVAGAAVIPEVRDGYMLFELRPLYTDLRPETLQVSFVHGRASKAWTSAVQYPLTPVLILEMAFGAALCAVCISRLCCAATKEENVSGINFEAVEERLQRIRDQHYVRDAGYERSVLAKRTLISHAGQRIRQLAFFGCRSVQSPADVHEDFRRSV